MRIFNYVSAALVAVVLVGCDGDARPFEEAVEVRALNLTSIAVVPPAISVDELVMNFGETAQFAVQGTGVIGQTISLESTDRDWAVTDETVASINDDGELVAKANGSVGVFVSIGGLVSETYDLRVSDSTLTNVESIVGESVIERCLPEDYQATGVYADGTERDLSSVAWTLATSDADNARLLNNPALTVTVTGLNSTDVTLTAAVSDFSLSLPITISNTLTALGISPTSGSVDVDDVLTFAAFGTYSEGDDTATVREANVTDSVDWQIESGATYASVTNSEDSRGVVTGLEPGSANLSVSCGNLEALPIQIIVSDSSDDDDSLSFLRTSPISLVEGNSSITLSVSSGSSYSSANSLDNDDLTWELSVDDTSDPAISLVDDGANAGRVTPLASGGATITVTDDDGASGSIRVEVTSN